MCADRYLGTRPRILANFGNGDDDHGACCGHTRVCATLPLLLLAILLARCWNIVIRCGRLWNDHAHRFVRKERAVGALYVGKTDRTTQLYLDELALEVC